MIDVNNFTRRPLPENKILEGRFVRLEPMQISHHLDSLFRASQQPDQDVRFRWLSENAPVNKDELHHWMVGFENKPDPHFFCIIDKANNEVVGRQALMRIDNKNGVIEIGHVYWGPDMQRTVKATEAFYLFASYVFDELQYRRFEWKCNNENVPSKKAATRFGFTYEGLFRQHMVQKGKNRDTAWFSMLDCEWPLLKSAFQQWFDPTNFDENGQQKQTLAVLIAKMR